MVTHMENPTAIAQKIANEADRLNVRIAQRGDVITFVRCFTPGNRAEYVDADIDLNGLMSLVPMVKAGSVWGTTSDGVGGMSAIKNGVYRLSSVANSLVLKPPLDKVAKIGYC